LHVLPPLDDSALVHVLSGLPLTADEAEAAMDALLTGGITADRAVASGPHGQTLRRLLRERAIDLLFLPAGEAVRGYRMTRYLRRLPCPVLCVDASATRLPVWWQTLRAEAGREPYVLRPAAAWQPAHRLVTAPPVARGM
jgi:hypothetical protein